MAGEDIGKTMFWIAIIIGVLIGATLIFVNKFQNSEIKEVSLSSDALFNGANFSLEEKDLFIVNFENKNYSFTLDSIEKDKISLKKGAIEYELIGSSSLEFDLNRDDIIDIIVSVIKIDEKKGVVNLSVEYPVIELCTELWSCSGWGDCIEGVRKRVCVDDNLCGTVLDKPALTEECEGVVQDETDYNGSVCDPGEYACYESQGFFCTSGYDINNYNPFCCLDPCVEFESNSSFCDARGYVYFSENKTHYCDVSRVYYFNETLIRCCSQENIVENTDINSILEELSLLDCSSTSPPVCGNLNLSDLTYVTFYDGGTVNMAVLDYDCSAVCLGDSFMNGCAQASLLIIAEGEEGSNLIRIETGSKDIDGNCLVNYTFEEYYSDWESSGEEGFYSGDLTGKSLICPYALDEVSVNQLSCFWDLCLEEGMPGGIVMGLLANFQLIIAADQEISEGCYGEIADLTDGKFVDLDID